MSAIESMKPVEEISSQVVTSSVIAPAVTAAPSLQFLTFTVGKEEYCVDIMLVREIKGWSETTRLPNTPVYMRGVMNLRGLIVPIIDLSRRFGGEMIKAHAKNVVIILAAEGRMIGILVDTVSDILNTTVDAIKPAPVGERGGQEAFVSGLISVDERMVVLLDVACLFNTEMDMVLQAAE